MFRIKTEKTKEFTQLISAIKILIDKVTFQATPEKIATIQMDPSRVAMVDFELPKKFFDEYECGVATKICINLPDLLKLLKRTQEATTEIVLKEDGRLGITFSQAGIKREFTLPTLEPYEEEVPTPKVTFTAKVKMIASEFFHATEDAQLVASYTRIKIDPDKMLMFDAKGDLMTALIELPKESKCILDLEATKEVKAAFSLSYLSEVAKAGNPLADLVILELATDMPIKLQYIMEQGRLVYYLAPRIEVE